MHSAAAGASCPFLDVRDAETIANPYNCYLPPETYPRTLLVSTIQSLHTVPQAPHLIYDMPKRWSWDAPGALNLHPHSSLLSYKGGSQDLTCIGKTLKGVRCRNRKGNSKEAPYRDSAARLLLNLSRLDPRSKEAEELLPCIAIEMLCHVHHNSSSQVSLIVETWTEALKSLNIHACWKIDEELTERRPVEVQATTSNVKLSSRAIWNPFATLGLDVGDQSHCIGFAPSKGRRCMIAVSASNFELADRSLKSLSKLEPTSKDVKHKLPKIARSLLSERYHQEQDDDIVSKWKRLIKAMPEQKATAPLVTTETTKSCSVQSTTLATVITESKATSSVSTDGLAVVQATARCVINKTPDLRKQEHNTPDAEVSKPAQRAPEQANVASARPSMPHADLSRPSTHPGLPNCGSCEDCVQGLWTGTHSFEEDRLAYLTAQSEESAKLPGQPAIQAPRNPLASSTFTLRAASILLPDSKGTPESKETETEKEESRLPHDDSLAATFLYPEARNALPSDLGQALRILCAPPSTPKQPKPPTSAFTFGLSTPPSSKQKHPDPEVKNDTTPTRPARKPIVRLPKPTRPATSPNAQVRSGDHSQAPLLVQDTMVSITTTQVEHSPLTPESLRKPDRDFAALTTPDKKSTFDDLATREQPNTAQRLPATPGTPSRKPIFRRLTRGTDTDGINDNRLDPQDGEMDGPRLQENARQNCPIPATSPPPPATLSVTELIDTGDDQHVSSAIGPTSPRSEPFDQVHGHATILSTRRYTHRYTLPFSSPTKTHHNNLSRLHPTPHNPTPLSPTEAADLVPVALDLPRKPEVVYLTPGKPDETNFATATVVHKSKEPSSRAGMVWPAAGSGVHDPHEAGAASGEQNVAAGTVRRGFKERIRGVFGAFGCFGWPGSCFASRLREREGGLDEGDGGGGGRQGGGAVL